MNDVFFLWLKLFIKHADPDADPKLCLFHGDFHDIFFIFYNFCLSLNLSTMFTVRVPESLALYS